MFLFKEFEMIPSQESPLKHELLVFGEAVAN
jgi:hypothetical protein